MHVIEMNPLQWINIDVPPRKLKITNTGYTGNTPYSNPFYQIGC